MKTTELTPSQRALQFARDIQSGATSQRQTAKKLGVGRTYLSFAQAVLGSNNTDLIKEVEDGLKSLRDAVQEAHGKPPVTHALPVVDPSLPKHEKTLLYQARHRAKHSGEILKYQREWHAEHREYMNAKQREKYDVEKQAARYRLSGRANYFLRKYGISLETIVSQIEKQRGACNACKRKFSKGRRPHVDHDHDLGHFRGVLCCQCNQAEGLLKTIDAAKGLVAYMEKNEVFYQAHKNGSE